MQKDKIKLAVLVAALVLIIIGLLLVKYKDDLPSSDKAVEVTENQVGADDNLVPAELLLNEPPAVEEGVITLTEGIVDGEIEIISFSQEAIGVTDKRFFSQDVKLKIDFPEGTRVFYTTNGKEPSGSSTEYTEPIELKAAKGDFPNCLVLKVKAYYADGSKSEVITHTFFAQKQMDSRFETVIFSISGDPNDLTNESTGILAGDNAQQRGQESERAVYIEAINSDGSVIFEQGAGIRPYGGASRGSSIKSMKLFARKEYDPYHGKFELNVFETIGTNGGVLSEYDKLVLRNYGNDLQFAFVRDELNQRLAAQAGYTDVEAVVPAVVYLNGKYYGLFYLHESYCDDFFKDKYGGSKDGHYEVLEGNELHKSENDDDVENVEAAEEFNFMYNYFAYADMTVEMHFDELCAFMDVENYLQYYAYNIYINNNDWPQNNYKCYRYYAAEGEAYGKGETDGRWRFLFHDMDFSMGLYDSNETIASYNNLKHIMNSKDDRYSPLFTNLMQREDCRQFFLDEMDRLMNGTLSEDNINAMLDSMLAEREGEMIYFFEHLEQLKKTDDSIWIWYEGYLERTDNIRKFAKERKAYMEKFLKEQFG